MATEQPPSGGCVLKHLRAAIFAHCIKQPPSGGCVLKQKLSTRHAQGNQAAAFGWLCVETDINP